MVYQFILNTDTALMVAGELEFSVALYIPRQSLVLEFEYEHCPFIEMIASETQTLKADATRRCIPVGCLS